MPRRSLLPRADTTDDNAAPSTANVGLDRLRSGLLALVRDTRQADLRLRQLAVLLLLVSTQGPRTIRGLAAMLRVPRASISRTVDRLETEDLAERLRDPSDLRSVLVEATPRGRRLAERLGEAFASETR